MSALSRVFARKFGSVVLFPECLELVDGVWWEKAHVPTLPVGASNFELGCAHAVKSSIPYYGALIFHSCQPLTKTKKIAEPSTAAFAARRPDQLEIRILHHRFAASAGFKRHRSGSHSLRVAAGFGRTLWRGRRASLIAGTPGLGHVKEPDLDQA